MPAELQTPARPAGPPLSDLYAIDEVAWLDAMAGLATAGRAGDLDLDHLAEYLSDMARSDRKGVKSHLTVLLMHLLKWDYQPDQRGTSWLVTIRTQRHSLADDFEDSRTLRRHAEAVLIDAYHRARGDAAAETGLPVATFPENCPYTLDQALAAPLTGGPTAAE